MPRKARVILPGVAHHVTQRGNNRQKVFFTEQEMSNYCFWVNEYALKYRVDILAYCLMPNHIHFICVPQTRSSLAQLFNTVHMRYAQHFNSKRNTSGHLWQGRFYSCVLSDDHLYYAIRYVEQNPVRAQMVPKPWDYTWSSAGFHVGQPAQRYILIKNTTLIDNDHWREYVTSNDVITDERLRVSTYKGIAFANQQFVEKWEKILNRPLREIKMRKVNNK